MKAAILSALVLALALASAGPALAGDPDTGPAVEAAETWLAAVDSGDYDGSWETAAEYFKKAMAKDRWRELLTAVREPLGGLISRKLEAAKYYTSLPGAPDGRYVVIQFNTSFENKKSAVETVTPMMDPDGQWRVSGYFIK